MLKKNHIITWFLVIIVLLLAVLAFVGMDLSKYIKHLNMTSVRDYINSYGRFSAVIYIVIFAIRTLFVVFPYSIMVILGGSLFGHFRGFIYSLISVFISASIAFIIGRVAGKDFIQKLVRGRIKDLDVKIEKHGFKFILLMRLSTIFPFDILNYAAGFSKVKYKDFILGTLLGTLPETFSLTYLGSNLGNPFSYEFILAVVLVICTITIPFIYSRRKRS